MIPPKSALIEAADWFFESWDHEYPDIEEYLRKWANDSLDLNETFAPTLFRSFEDTGWDKRSVRSFIYDLAETLHRYASIKVDQCIHAFLKKMCSEVE